MYTKQQGSFVTSSQAGGKEHRRPLTYRPSVEDHFFGPSSRPIRAAQKSKPSSSAINNNLPFNNDHTSPEPLCAVDKPSSSKATFRWMKGDLIGSGSHGKVYMGLNVNTGEFMAVKQVELPKTSRDRVNCAINKIVQALKDERETLKDLDHDNIVQYLGFEDNLETLNIFLQYVAGGTIRSCYRQYGIFREDVTKEFTSQILEGLTYLHAQNVIHRDLKSDNILVEESGVCKISDFGISKKLSELDHAVSEKGTYYWMAPEVFTAGKVGYDAKVDIWSMGCLVFEMWTAKQPWYNEHNFMSVFPKLMDMLPPPLPEDCNLSPLAEDFRKQCFHPDPRGRPQASRLRTHPYLQLPDGWSFPGMLNMGAKPAATKEFGEIAEPFSRTSDITSNSREQSSSAKELNSEFFPPCPGNDFAPHEPPLVYIEPPGPPRHKHQQSIDWMMEGRSSSRRLEYSGSQRTGQSDSRNSRPLIIYNPDSADYGRPKKRQETPVPQPYIYVPPPLPGLDANQVPYSVHLAPLPPVRFNDLVPHSLGIAHVIEDKLLHSKSSYPSNLLTTPSHLYEHHTRLSHSPDNYISTVNVNNTDDNFSDSGSDFSTFSTSIWKKPPPNVARTQRYQNSSNKTILRPAVKEVIEHLEDFFSDHNLDEPVVEASTMPGLRSVHTMRSVKTIAEQQMSSPVRQRQTMLWDSHIEEIKAPR